MEIKDLTFTYNEEKERYEAKFTSEGACAVQIERDITSEVAIMVNIPGMKPTTVDVYRNPFSATAVIDINVAAGLEVTLLSKTEVSDAKMLVV